jgi:hypothetical protein
MGLSSSDLCVLGQMVAGFQIHEGPALVATFAPHCDSGYLCAMCWGSYVLDLIVTLPDVNQIARLLLQCVDGRSFFQWRAT